MPGMDISVRTVGGRELATLAADPAWKLRDVVTALPEVEESSPFKRPRILLGEEELHGGRTLADLGATTGKTAELTLLIAERPCVLTGSNDATAKLWCRETGECLRTFEGHEHPVISVAFAPDGTVLTASHDDTARLWCPASGKCLRTLRGHTRFLTSLAVSRDGSRVLTASGDGTAKLWDFATGDCVRTLEGHEDFASFVAFSPDGKLIATGAEDGLARLWRTETGEVLRSLHTGSFVRSVALSPDHLLTAGDHVQLWSLSTGWRAHCFADGDANAAIFSPDFQSILVTFGLGHVKLYCAKSKECLRSFDCLTGGTTSCFFSKDGEEFLTGSFDAKATLVSTSGGQCLRCFEGHRQKVSSAALSH